MCRSMVYIQSAAAEIRRGNKKIERKIETTGQKYNGLFYSIRRRYTRDAYDLMVRCSQKQCKLECGPMPNVMVALPNIGGALCSTPQSLVDADYMTDVQ